jgi:hypothetical protein
VRGHATALKLGLATVPALAAATAAETESLQGEAQRLHEALVHGGADVVELGQHGVLGDVDGDLRAKDVGAAPQQLPARAQAARVVHLLRGPSGR